MTPRKTSRNVVAVAIVRELAGFLWAEMTADLAQPDTHPDLVPVDAAVPVSLR